MLINHSEGYPGDIITSWSWQQRNLSFKRFPKPARGCSAHKLDVNAYPDSSECFLSSTFRRPIARRHVMSRKRVFPSNRAAKNVCGDFISVPTLNRLLNNAQRVLIGSFIGLVGSDIESNFPDGQITKNSYKHPQQWFCVLVEQQVKASGLSTQWI